MEVDILSRARLERWSRKKWFQRSKPVIIYLSFSASPPLQLGPVAENKILHIKFEKDVVNQKECSISDESARKICDYVLQNIKERTLIVSCPVGTISAAGVAAAIEEFINGSADWIFRETEYSPNMNCYERVKNAFSKSREAKLRMTSLLEV